MLTKEEKNFILYWEHNREREKRIFRQLATGLPIGSLIAIGILLSLFSGWYERADMVAGGQLDPNVLIVALLIIVVFIAIFHKKHKWDMNEEQYWMLKKKEEKEKSPNI